MIAAVCRRAALRVCSVLVVVVAVMVINLFESVVACVSVCWLMIVVKGQA